MALTNMHPRTDHCQQYRLFDTLSGETENTIQRHAQANTERHSNIRPNSLACRTKPGKVTNFKMSIYVGYSVAPTYMIAAN